MFFIDSRSFFLHTEILPFLTLFVYKLDVLVHLIHLFIYISHLKIVKILTNLNHKYITVMYISTFDRYPNEKSEVFLRPYTDRLTSLQHRLNLHKESQFLKVFGLIFLIKLKNVFLLT